MMMHRIAFPPANPRVFVAVTLCRSPSMRAALAGSAHCLYPDVATAVSSMKLTTFRKLAAAGGVSLDSPTWVGTAFLPAETVSETGKGGFCRGSE